MYIDPRGKPLAHLDRLQAWKVGETPAPVSVEWDLSNVCSLGCQSCHFAHTHTKGPWATHADLPPNYTHTGIFADTRLVMRGLREMSGAGVQAVIWSGGGEPTLHPDRVAIWSFAHTAGLQQGLYTLGGHVTKDLGQHIRELFSWVVVSLDAPNAGLYAIEKGVGPERFKGACDGIERMVGGACAVGVSFLLGAHNWHRTDSMLSLSRMLGATYATFRPVVETDHAHPSVMTGDRAWVTDALPILTKLAAERDVEIDVARFLEYRDWTQHGYATCYGIRLSTMVTPDGRIWVCPNRRGIAGSELGDLRTESFEDIWARHPRQWTDFQQCRAMCRLHLVNRTLASVYQERTHEAFV